MTYVLSDPHGHYKKYLRMLDKICFSDDDDLYVLGDVVDRGPEPMELLRDMSMRMNVFPILGNHDRMAAYLLRKLCVEITEENYATQVDADTLRALLLWQADGGQTTLDGFRKLPPDEREALLDYFDEFVPYQTLEVGGNRFLLVHGGVPYETRTLPLDRQPVEELLTVRPDYARRYYDNVYLVTGHTPTVHIGKEFTGTIYRRNGHIALDCGTGFDLPLGCLRLDDFREFYVR